MKLIRTSGYGLYALLHLASQPAESQLSVGEIAASRALPKPFLNKILQMLVRAGLVRSARGTRGGFALARAPAEIALREAVEALQGPLTEKGCPIKGRECEQSSVCSVNAVWREIEECELRILGEKTLADLLQDDGVACISSSGRWNRRRGRKARDTMRERRP